MKKNHLLTLVLSGASLLLSATENTSTIFYNGFDTAADFARFTMVDDIPASSDVSLAWEYDATTQSAKINLYDTGFWVFLITPSLQLQTGTTYSVSVKAQLEAAYGEQSLSIYIGTANTLQEIRKKRIINTPVTNTGTWQNIETEFTVTEDGTYYIGILDASMDYNCIMFIDDVTIKAKHLLSAPDAVTELTATAGENGSKKASISFRAPEIDMEGNDINYLEKIELYRAADLIETFENPTPSNTCNYTDLNATEGINTYNVYAYNESGKGRVATTSVFVGIDSPATPANVTATDKGESITISWDAPTVGKNGGYIDPSQLTYNITDLTTGKHIENIQTTSYSYSPTLSTRQELFQFEVVATNPTGTGDAANSNTVMFGEPYTVPFQESFAGTKNTAGPWGVQIINQGGDNPPLWIIREQGLNPLTAPQDHDYGVISFRPMSSKDKGFLYSGKISLENTTEPVLQFYIYNNNRDNNVLKVLISLDGGSFSEVKNINILELGKTGWNKVMVPLSNYLSAGYIQVGFEAWAQSTYLGCIHIDNIRIKDLLEYDLVATGVIAPKGIKAGCKDKIKVEIFNDGENTATGYSVALYRDGKLEKTQEGTTLAADEETELAFDIVPDPRYSEETSFYAIIVYNADQNQDNNTTPSVSLKITPSPYPTATNLNATVKGDKAELNWTAPVIGSSIPTTEDFESYHSFITAEIGEWTLVDNDGLATTIPSDTYGKSCRFDNAGNPMAYIVFNPEEAGLQTTDALGQPSSWAPHSGESVLAAFSSGTDMTDDWFISPLLAQNANTLSFFARKISELYGTETLEILYSTTGNNISDFSSLLEINLEGRWNEYRYNLPASTKHFAIRHKSFDSLAALIDDITFYPSYLDFDNMTLTGYNIYRDDVKINTITAENTSFTDTPETTGVYTYAVTAVYDKGESAYSNLANADFSNGAATLLTERKVKVYSVGGAILIENAEGFQVQVFGVDGKILFENKKFDGKRIYTAPGIYLAKVGNKSYKVVVQ